MGAWIECTECVFASNSPKAAAAHVAATGHRVEEEED